MLHGPSTEFIATSPRERELVAWINGLFEVALKKEYSDIHLETDHDNEDMRVRVRFEGSLREIHRLDAADAHLLATKIRSRCRLSQNDTRAPQDGRFLQICGDRRADVRVSIMVTGTEGVSVVMRLLDSANAGRAIGSLEMPPAVEAVFQANLRRKEGMILAAGPTGSGKTTTLYAALNALNTPDRKNISIEDPIEYHQNGVQQVQVGEGTGRTFASVLRAVLRQDPDGILVGEIRDEETASIAAKAAMTGHIVLSTIHTNSAVETITRLLDMGLPLHVMKSALRLIIAQRLVPTLCPVCKADRPVTDEDARIFLEHGVDQPEKLKMAVGCPECQRGYRGRVAIFEVLEVNAAFRRALGNDISQINDNLLLEAAMAQPQYMPIRKWALRLAAQGRTTLEKAMELVYED
ncbi:type II/IV secretion system protein [Acidithiobacillus sp. MC6.1]|nr:type II/IV secretion system protein [Acidithiobacillus sp. MC6.1]